MSRFPRTTATLLKLAALGCVFALLSAPLWVLKALLAIAILGVIALSLVADLRKT